MPDEFLEKVHALASKGEPFVIATVVRAQRPTSAKAGSKAIISANGTLWGWVGGSCAQPAVIEQAMEALKDGNPRFLRLGPAGVQPKMQDEGVIHYTHTCASHGSLDVFVEPFLPKPQVIVVGHERTAQVLAKFAKLLEYRVIVVNPLATAEKFPEADMVLQTLDLKKLEITPQTYVVVATHQTYPGETDEALLEELARSGAEYISLVAGKRRAGAAARYLLRRGVSRDLLTKVKSPAGIDINAVTPDEIALSVLAEIVGVRRGKKFRSIVEDEAAYETPVEVVQAANAQSTVGLAVDPVCKMEVDKGTAVNLVTFKGQTFYFCSSACRRSFESMPEKYAKLGLVST